MKFSTLTALIGTTTAGHHLGHKAEMSTMHKSFKQSMTKVKSAELMELQTDQYYATADY